MVSAASISAARLTRPTSARHPRATPFDKRFDPCRMSSCTRNASEASACRSRYSCARVAPRGLRTATRARILTAVSMARRTPAPRPMPAARSHRFRRIRRRRRLPHRFRSHGLRAPTGRASHLRDLLSTNRRCRFSRPVARGSRFRARETASPRTASLGATRSLHAPRVRPSFRGPKRARWSGARVTRVVGRRICRLALP
jgi:hypothetical protein